MNQSRAQWKIAKRETQNEPFAMIASDLLIRAIRYSIHSFIRFSAAT